MKYLIRTDCEYSIIIEAESAEQAEEKAEKVPVTDWEQSWATWETEELADFLQVEAQ